MKRMVICFVAFLLALPVWSIAQDVAGTWSAPQMQLIITFNEDGTYVWQDSRNRLEGTYAVYESVLYMDYQEDTSQYQVTVQGDNLTLQDQSGNVVRLVRGGGAGGSTPAGSSPLVGEWASPRYGIRLQLDAGGTYEFATSRGRWQADDGRITFTDASTGSPTVYEYRLDGERLKFRDANGNIIDFERRGAAAGGGLATAPPVAGAARDDLLGEWRCTTVNGLRVTFGPDGRYRFATDHGHYKVAEGRIRFSSAVGGGQSVYDYRLQDGQLLLRDPQGNTLPFQREAMSAATTAPAGVTGRLVGSWRAKNMNLDVVFSADGGYRFGPDSGRYQADERQIRFTSAGSGATSTYDYRFSGGDLQIRDSQGNVITLVRQTNDP
ncbi:MAG: hypothetical protein JXQ27_15175 [Acidobacteria bacterium]|nr:hypothetical protein [Acidobacteriota bacterium]